jgi:hypothetical protein
MDIEYVISIRTRSALIDVITNATNVLIEAIMNVNEKLDKRSRYHLKKISWDGRVDGTTIEILLVLIG